MEIADATRSPDPTQFISHQPVHQDGSCNGLQHYAALGQDSYGAKQVNLVPADRPQDVYEEVWCQLFNLFSKKKGLAAWRKSQFCTSQLRRFDMTTHRILVTIEMSLLVYPGQHK